MKIFSGLIAIWILLFCSVAGAEERIPSISVDGQGIVETSPDRATLSVSVISRNRDAAKVQSESARIATEVINAVARLGVERRNIRTGNYNFREVFRSDQNGKRISEGYEAKNSISIAVDDLKILGKVIDAALSHGAKNVDSLNFEIRDKAAFQREAIRLATRDAREKAAIVAAELGKNIIGVINVSVNSASISAPRFQKNAMLMVEESAMADFETPIETGTLSCSAHVHIEFEISR